MIPPDNPLLIRHWQRWTEPSGFVRSPICLALLLAFGVLAALELCLEGREMRLVLTSDASLVGLWGAHTLISTLWPLLAVTLEFHRLRHRGVIHALRVTPLTARELRQGILWPGTLPPVVFWCVVGGTLVAQTIIRLDDMFIGVVAVTLYTLMQCRFSALIALWLSLRSTSAAAALGAGALLLIGLPHGILLLALVPVAWLGPIGLYLLIPGALVWHFAKLWLWDKAIGEMEHSVRWAELFGEP